MVDWRLQHHHDHHHHHHHDDDHQKQLQGFRKGPWTTEEDKLLSEYVTLHGEGRWSSVAKCAGLNRSGKSCRLRWVNYLRPGLKRGQITPQEEGIIIELHALWGNKWSTIARYLPGRTDNEIKNYWRTHFKKKVKSSSKKDKVKKSQSHKTSQQTLTQTQTQTQTPHNDMKLDDPQDIAPFIFPSDITTTVITATNAAAIALEDQYHYTTATIAPCSSDQSMIDDEGYLWGSLWNLDDNIPHGCFGGCVSDLTPGGNGVNVSVNVSKVCNVDAQNVHALSSCGSVDYTYSAFFTGGFIL